MTDSPTNDFEFDISESMLNPFRGTLQFTVRKKMEIKNFEFSTHEMGCRRIGGQDVIYGLKLKLNGNVLFTYQNIKVDVDVSDILILTPGNTYQLESWVGGHTGYTRGQTLRSCQYHYAQIYRSNRKGRAPFTFIFPDDEDNHAEPSNKTCLYIIQYKIVD